MRYLGAGMNEDVGRNAILIDDAPETLPHALGPDEDFVNVPFCLLAGCGWPRAAVRATRARYVAPAAQRPLAHSRQLRCLHLAQLRRIPASQNTWKLRHLQRLPLLRPARPTLQMLGSYRNRSSTGQIVRELPRIPQPLAKALSLCLRKSKLDKPTQA
jgi:hypothetical protein